MNSCRYRQLLAIYIGTERFGHVSDEGSTAVARQLRDRLGHGKRGEVTGHKLLRQRELRRRDCRAHPHVPKASRGHEGVQLGGIMERRGRSGHGAGLGTYVSRQRIGEGGLVRCVVDGAPHGEGQAAAEAENSTHLPQRLNTIREELQTLLTQDSIESTILEW